MADKPLIFSAPMVHALLDGRKTQTRRVLKEQPFVLPGHDSIFLGPPFSRMAYSGMHPTIGKCVSSPRYDPGDRLWVREAWGLGVSDHGDCPRYRATLDYQCGDKIKSEHEGAFVWRSPIYMPRRFSRLTLIVTDVRVQRVQEINGMDAKREGVSIPSHLPQDGADLDFAKRAFHALWDDLNTKRGFGWDANPWVVALTFTVHHQNIDQLQQEAA